MILIFQNLYNRVSLSTINNSSAQIRKIFTSQSVKQRVKQFSILQSTFQLEKNQSPKQLFPQIPIPQIINPSYLKFDSAKNLSSFIKENNVKPNIRILHALAHIEYNAFMAYAHTYFTLSNQIKEDFHRNLFLNEIKQIACDQGDHFCMLYDRLQQLGFTYGSLPVIDQLYLAIYQTNNSLIERISRISLLHEGKGMKAISKLISQLQKQKDYDSTQILRVIQKQEIYHFRNGVKWFKYICEQEQINYIQALKKLGQKKQFRQLNVDEIIKCIEKKQFDICRHKREANS